jgi:hypothetical protein
MEDHCEPLAILELVLGCPDAEHSPVSDRACLLTYAFGCIYARRAFSASNATAVGSGARCQMAKSPNALGGCRGFAIVSPLGGVATPTPRRHG